MFLSALFRSVPDGGLFLNKSEQLQNMFETSSFFLLCYRHMSALGSVAFVPHIEEIVEVIHLFFSRAYFLSAS